MKHILSLLAIFWVAQGAKFQTIKEKEESSSPAFAGQVVGLKNGKETRFVKMKEDLSIGGSGVSSTLHDTWTLERFKVVDVGGDFALHNTELNRFLTVVQWWNGPRLGASMQLSEIEHGRGGEQIRFKWVSMWGYYQIYHQYSRRFLRMNSDGSLGLSSEMGWQEMNGVGGAASQGLANVRPYDWTVVTSTFTASCGSRYVAAGASCKSELIGKTVGLRSPTHDRWARMTNMGVMDASITGRSTLPDDWTWERFEVVDAGKGEIALHNTHQNRFITMTSAGAVTYSKLWSEFELPISSLGERFKVVDAGNNEIALHNAQANRFLMMTNQAQMAASGVQNWNSLPASWTWERFEVHETDYVAFCASLYFHKGASCKAWLIGQTVAFYNPWHQRFMQMVANDWQQLSISAPVPSGELCNECTPERFDVVDLGDGYVGLYHAGLKRYVYMSWHDHEIEATTIWNKQDLPAHHEQEKFRVVDLGNNRIGLHNPKENRFIMMGSSGMVRSAVFNWDALPAWNHDWERFTVDYAGTARGPDRYTVIAGKKCKGQPYTHDMCKPGQCNGWGGLTEVQCWEKCEKKKIPAGCDQQQHCVAAVWYDQSWCHLFSVCEEYDDASTVKILKRVESPFLLQVEAANDIIEKPELKALDDLAVTIPLALINVSNFSGLVSSKNLSHMGMEHHFGNYSQDVALLLDKVAGFYTMLHKVMGADADIYCPHEHHYIEKCLKMATCALVPAVEAGTVPMAFHASILEQLVSFDILWQNIIESFMEENESYTVPPHIEVPEKYRCDLFKPADVANIATVEGSSLLQDDEGSWSSQTLALSTALADAFVSTDAILNSHTENTSIHSTMQRFEELWSPICNQMDCDPSNYWDIHLSSHKQTMALMQVGKRAASHMMKEIIHRSRMQRNFQKLLLKSPALIQIFRPTEAQAASEESVDAYGRAGGKAVRGFMQKFTEAPGGEAKALGLIDLVEYRKFRDDGISVDGRMAHVLPSGKIQNDNVSLVEVKSRGIWDFIKNLVKCFGSFARFYAQGYSKSFGSRVAANVGFAGGDSVGLQKLVRDGESPSAFISIYASVTAGTATKKWWAGLSLSFSLSLGCANNGYSCTAAISLGAIGCAVLPYTNYAVCPFGQNAWSFECSQAYGGAFSIICCSWDLRTGDNTCR